MNVKVLAKILKTSSEELNIETVEIPLDMIQMVQEMRNDVDEFWSWLLSVSDKYKALILIHIFKGTENYFLNLTNGKNIGFQLNNEEDDGTVIMGTDFESVQLAINNMHLNMLETLSKYGLENEND